MANPRLKNRTLRRLGIVALTLLCAVLVMNAIFGDHGLLALRRQRREYESIEKQVYDLEKENAQLEKQIKALKSDPKAIEKEARERLHLAKPGEIIYTLPEHDPKSEDPASARNSPSK